ncbi:Putative phenazine biosynthesis PhzF protein [Septoria linicola]|uniref:Phenazine biosynthesis PhzF protein n=1 Tax=Septoria linicola TaxID=215465 RepID=A0A9Q9EML6_9PEZI|nr:Putative phenazine biosynthesis PhzF protein [Septoria linicola]
MPQLNFVTLDVFTTEKYAGNPLAVVRVPEGQDVSTEQMQKIAREFNLSETIFLHDAQSSADGLQEWRVRIFLTNAEIPFAGHPTIGAAVYALSNLSADSSSDSRHGRLIANAGPMELTYNRATGIAKAGIAHSFHEHTQYPFTVEDVYSLQPSLEQSTPLVQKDITIVSPVKGMNFIAVELPSLDVLASMGTSKRPEPKLDDEWNTGFSGSYYYVYTSAPIKDGDIERVRVQSRMIEGLFEDPATGSAACAFACYAAVKRGGSKITQFSITQGVEMGRKSDIEVTVTLTSDLKSVEHVELGGSAVKVMEGVVEY